MGMLINLLFYAGVGAASYIIAVGFVKFDKMVNRKFQHPEIPEAVMDNIWFIKYEQLRKEIGNDN